ncbi:glycosyltransferase [Sporolactobacillus sp. CQH2019]|uniref:glycosyltransferase n=1 Tax=Sporolactobacillus sp. CQH2019 TaxID=3023512 RepID=UPI0023686DD7|nr:glycosyltransferase [Sporolactobacillus sp. CQH2019]MDD9148851.1 glycosyltransferase [Sporolactobacillus sp. CQH2019]
MFKNKRILFLAMGGKNWIGGLYYVKNVIYTLIHTNELGEHSKIYILVKRENYDLFKKFQKYNFVQIILFKDSILNKVFRKLSNKLKLDIELLYAVKKHKIDLIFPVTGHPNMFLKNKSVFWIPDFQHFFYPQFFTKETLQGRDSLHKYIARQPNYLVLSSEDAKNSFAKFYPDHLNTIKIIKFQSDLEDEVGRLTDSFVENTLNKYNITGKYAILCNQFFNHKNHLVAFKAINYIKQEKGQDICLICTGNNQPVNNNKKHIEDLNQYIKDNHLEKDIKILGLIPRMDQLALIKASCVLVQPSLFEGWGTSVEDAKWFHKKMILSDINVHYEQKNEDCVIFHRTDFKDLGDKILNVLSTETN